MVSNGFGRLIQVVCYLKEGQLLWHSDPQIQKVSDKIEGRIYPLLVSEGRSEDSRKQFTQAESSSVIFNM